MKTFNTGVCELLFVSVPKGAHHFRIGMGYLYFKNKNTAAYLDHDNSIRNEIFDNRKHLEIISLLSSITEEQCKGLVNDSLYYLGFHTNYITPLSNHKSDNCKTAKQSLQSAIVASGIEQKEDNDILILKVFK